MKKLIGHLSKSTSYKIIDHYCTVLSSKKDENKDNTELYSVCQNCNKKIFNVVVVSDASGNSFKVGSDCASTLLGITEIDITNIEKNFKYAKSERARIKRSLKSANAKLYIFNGDMHDQDVIATRIKFKFPYGWCLTINSNKTEYIDKYSSFANKEFWSKYIYPSIIYLAKENLK